MRIKITSILLVLVLIMTTFLSACGKKSNKDIEASKGKKPSAIQTDTDEDYEYDFGLDYDEDYELDIEEDYDPKKLNLTQFGSVDYPVIYSQNASAIEVGIIKNFASLIDEKFGLWYEPYSDSIRRDEEVPELLIGNTNRPESEYALNLLRQNRKNCYNDFIIMAAANKSIVIQATSNSALEKALNVFLEKFCSEDEIIVPYNFGYFYTPKYNANNSKIVGVSLDKWQIVTPVNSSFIYRKEIDNFVFAIASSTGYELPVVNDKSKEISNEILIGQTNRSQSKISIADSMYLVKQNGTKIILKGNSDLTVSDAVVCFSKMIIDSLNAKNSFSIPSGINVSGSVKGRKDGYNLVWSEEFSGNSYDKYFSPYGSAGYTTEGHQGSKSIYDNSKRTTLVENGNLILKGVALENGDYLQPDNLVSRGKFTFDYGYIEISCKLPKGNGSWPSFWLSRDITQFETSPEIDVFEAFGVDNLVLSNLHFWWHQEFIEGGTAVQHIDYSSNNDIKMGYALPQGTSYAEEYHTIGCERTPEYIAFYVDGIKTGEIPMSIDKMSMFDQLMEIRFSMPVNSKSYPGVTKDSIMEFKIDYVRLYQIPGVGTVSNHF